MSERAFPPAWTIMALLLLLTAPGAAQTNGPLRVHGTNGRYFADASGAAVYLTGSHTWSNFQDNGNGDPPPAFDYAGYLRWMKGLNHNFMRLWSWEQSRWTSETWDDQYWFSPQPPYKRTGPGLALDGKPKFNLDSLDDAYFQRLRSRVEEARSQGIYVSVMLFNGWSVSNRLGFRQPFQGSPFHGPNNVNGVAGDRDGDGDGEETHSLQDARVTGYQMAYVKRVIDAVNDLDNVLYEITNESPYAGSDAWQRRMIDTIHAYEARKPYRHPVGYTGDWTIANADLWTSNAEWISPGGGDNGRGYQDDPPAGSGSKVVITDSDHLWGVGGDRVWVWKSFLRGLNPIFMDGYDGKSYGCGGVNFDSSAAQWLRLRESLGYTRRFAQRMDLAGMTPQNGLSSTTYCLAKGSGTASEYLVYQPASGASFTLDLRGASGPLSVEWFDPEDGRRVAAGTVQGGGGRLFTPPFERDAVLLVYGSEAASAHVSAAWAPADSVPGSYRSVLVLPSFVVLTVQVLQVPLLLLLGFFILYLFVLSVLALFARKRTSFDARTTRKFCIVVPAHNEEKDIERTVRSLVSVEYPADRFTVVVVADNCTDATAANARNAGAEVLERTDTVNRGKGYALRYCFDRMLSADRGFDAFAVVDADSVVSADFLRVLNHTLGQGATVVQATDIVEPQPGVWSSEMTRIGFLLYNYVRAFGRSVLGLPTGLHGNGMCFSADALRAVPWKAYSIAEDLEYGLLLLLNGHRTVFAPEAVVTAMMPQQSVHAQSQRARWEGGRFPVMKRFAGPLLKAAFTRRSYIYFDRLVDLVTPPLMNMIMLSVLLSAVNAALWFAGLLPLGLVAAAWGIVAAAGTAHMFIGLAAARADKALYLALLYLPKYALWKIGMIASLVRASRSDEWVRTTRETDGNPTGPAEEKNP